MSETIAALDRAIVQFAAALNRVAQWAAAASIDLTETGYADWAALLRPQRNLQGPAEDLAAKRAHLAMLHAALHRVEEWSFDTVHDLMPAGYSKWVSLLHGRREPKTCEELLRMGEEIKAHDDAQREQARAATRH